MITAFVILYVIGGLAVRAFILGIIDSLLEHKVKEEYAKGLKKTVGSGVFIAILWPIVAIPVILR